MSARAPKTTSSPDPGATKRDRDIESKSNVAAPTSAAPTADAADTFNEDDWGSGAETAWAGERSTLSDLSSTAPPQEPPAKRTSTVTFATLHQPGDSSFSPIALPPGVDPSTSKDTADSRVWQRAGVCCCLQCELLRVVVAFSSSKCKTIALVDVDNTLWADLVTPLTHSVSNSGSGRVRGRRRPLPPATFVWGFYGAGFEGHNGNDPRRVCDAPPRGSPLHILSPIGSAPITTMCSSGAADGAVLRKVYLTPCGGSKDAADGVLVEAAGILRNVPTLVVSGDTGLVERAVVRRAEADERAGGVTARMVVLRPAAADRAADGPAAGSDALWERVVTACVQLGGGNPSDVVIPSATAPDASATTATAKKKKTSTAATTAAAGTVASGAAPAGDATGSTTDAVVAHAPTAQTARGARRVRSSGNAAKAARMLDAVDDFDGCDDVARSDSDDDCAPQAEAVEVAAAPTAPEQGTQRTAPRRLRVRTKLGGIGVAAAKARLGGVRRR